MKKLFVLLVLVGSFAGCCFGPVDTTPKYKVSVFSGGQVVATYNDCYDYMKYTSSDSYLLWTNHGIIHVSGTITIENIQK